MKINALRMNIAFVSALLFSCAAFADDYSWGDSFEGFSGESGTTINNTASDSGLFTWDASGTVIVMKKDGTAYHRKNYMRISDTSSDQRYATITLSDDNRIPFAVCPTDASGTVYTPFSFAFRRTLVEGQEENVTGLNLTIYCSTTDDDPTTATIMNGLNIFANIDTSDNDWYLFEADLLNYHWSSAKSQPIVYNIRITKVGSDTPVYTNTNNYRSNFSKYADVVVTGIKFMTWSTGQGLIDIDDINVGNYEYPAEPGVIFLVR